MPAETTEQQPDLAALIVAAAAHPDRWFSALARTYLEGAPDDDTGVDADLVSRLEAERAAGVYTPLDVLVESHEAPGPHGPVPLRVYLPRDDALARPLLVWLHGGGFLGGDLDMPEADATGRELCHRAGAVVVSVDYRLATRGVHFPVPHDDAVAAYSWSVDRFRAGAPAVIGGASAGACLAAGVTLRLRDEGRAPAGVMLLYPLVHPELPEPSEELAARLALLPASHTFRGSSFTPMLENYLGAPVGEATAYALAGLGALEHFPPTLIINCEYDGLRASGERFSADLRTAGVEVMELLAPDVLHGHINAPWLAQAQQSYADMAQWLSEHHESP